ncbi:3-(3-hydroxyphenyl)propionate hydroxylase [Escherichia coli]|nr:bifunctional 3-(3-hydroxy-phenyl)propionate/3-hydroxycinnamic acid hydroxylase [Escherichia coli]STI99089.1 3-(3-hydroxyphenyl)propionate hydroxylase [Escherichia coli]
MAIQHPDIQPAVNHSVQVAIAGAGPVGLMMANYLGQMGIDVLVVEKLDKLIDYPRAIGIDDEALRTMQSVGLVENVLPHTTPWHAMRFLTPKGRCFADIQPMTDEFGWPRRNAFIQPQVDAVMLEGVSRFPNVRCLFSRELEAFSQQNDEVTLHLKTAEGQREIVKAQWLVACDGGASFVRRTLNVPFEGKTAPNQWIVVDIANDPLSTPHIYLCCDPVRPYVSAALPHAVRRFEFMVMPGETEEQLREPQNMRKLLSKVLPNPDNVELIRQRVYTHNARLAQRFRIDRVLLAGDAAHIMPVWQGQGYNSGMRDAFNLAWKLALVIQGKARDALLDTYQQERRDHAKAMIDLSVTTGNVLAPPKRWQGTLRDGVSWLLNYLPPVKRYFLEMRFKPMPQYYGGALVREGEAKHSPVGKMFIQPKVTLENGDVTLLDNAIGANFAVIGWGCNPLWGMSDEQIQQWRALGTRFIQVVPEVQIHTAQDNHDGVLRVGDTQGRLRSWFAQHNASLVVMRPDRFVAATSRFLNVEEAGKTLRIHFNDCGQGDETVVLLHGSGPGATGWANFSRNIDPLVEAGYRVILLDCPGWGKSDSIVNSGSRSDLNARILKSVVDQLDIAKIHLLGNSMGGHSSVAFTLKWPERVGKLVLMGGGTGGMSLFTPMPTEGIKRLNQLYRQPTIENLKLMMDIFVFDTSDLTDALFEARLNNMLSRRDHLENFVKSLEANPKQFPDFGPRLAEIKAQTLIVWGRNDRFVPMDAGLRLLSGIAGSELHIFRDCGHWAQWEHADAFNQLVLNFLARP